MLRIYYADNTVQILNSFHPSFTPNKGNLDALVDDISKGSPVNRYTFDKGSIESKDSISNQKNKTVQNEKTKKRK